MIEVIAASLGEQNYPFIQEWPTMNQHLAENGEWWAVNREWSAASYML